MERDRVQTQSQEGWTVERVVGPCEPPTSLATPSSATRRSLPEAPAVGPLPPPSSFPSLSGDDHVAAARPSTVEEVWLLRAAELKPSHDALFARKLLADLRLTALLDATPAVSLSPARVAQRDVLALQWEGKVARLQRSSLASAQTAQWEVERRVVAQRALAALRQEAAVDDGASG